jgi:hypothetical protein
MKIYMYILLQDNMKMKIKYCYVYFSSKRYINEADTKYILTKSTSVKSKKTNVQKRSKVLLDKCYLLSSSYCFEISCDL